MADMFPPTLDEQIICVEREIDMRLKVYPKWVDKGRMSQKRADREIETMKAVMKTLEGLR